MRHIDKIQHLDDERQAGNGWMVYLKPGWAIADANTPNAQHVFGEDKKPDVWKTMRDAEPCECKECIRLLTEVAE